MGRLSGRAQPGRLRKPAPRLVAKFAPDGATSGAARRSKNWLNTAAWQKVRLDVLKRDNYICRQTGVALVGKHPAPNSPVVDHIIPHRGDPKLFWDQSNMQSVSKAWHDSEKQSREKRGEV